METPFKVIFWNIWGGKHSAKVLAWIRKNPAHILCLQEVFTLEESHEYEKEDRGMDPRIFKKLHKVTHEQSHFSTSDVGKDFVSFSSHYREIDDPEGAHPALEQGLAMFWDKQCMVTLFEYEIHNSREEGAGLNTSWLLQVAEVNIPSLSKKVTIANVRGLWSKEGKADNVFRIQQSEKIVEALKKHSGPYILGGDLNILPDTKSLEILKDFGLRNLLEEFDITTTRSNVHPAPSLWADYCLVSDEIKVISFSVPQTDASDHLPLILECKF